MRNALITSALLLASAFAAVSCAKEADFQDKGLVFTGAVAELGAPTKTVLDPTDHILWDTGDEIDINDVVYVATPSAGDAGLASFVKKNASDADPTATFNAIFPASLNNSGYAFPQTQTYTPGHIGNIPMAATSDENRLHFYCICGVVELTLKGTETVKKINVQDALSPLWGAFSVDYKGSDTHAIPSETEAQYRDITLDCGTGVSLTGEGVKFWISIPEGEHELTFSVVTTDGKIYTKTTKSKVEVKAAHIYPFEWSPSFTTPDYLYFKAAADNTQITLNINGTPTTNELEYSTDAKAWTGLEYGKAFPATPLNTDEEVYIRAKTARTVAQTPGDYVQFSIAGSGSVGGNLMYLVSPDASNNVMSDYLFFKIFCDCKGLVSSTNLSLPATSLAENCYENMFLQCVEMLDTPVLPALKLEQNCYQGMFNKCEKLTTPPQLPATELAKYCYFEMFKNCAKLTSAPELNALNLRPYCYDSMFSGCDGLTVCPALPSNHLAEGCYEDMFEECHNIKSAPVLAAEHLVDFCYGGMFRDCFQMTSITCLATDMSANGCFDNWVDGVSSYGIFTKAKGVSWTLGKHGIPDGWEVKEYSAE